MVAEILAGIALAKSAVSGIKSMIDTANDVNDIAHHIDNLFKSRDQVKRDINKNKNAKKPKSKMRAMFNKKMNEDEDDDLSVGAVATMVLEQKKMDREIMNLGIRIDNKFGEGTWTEILETRKKMNWIARFTLSLIVSGTFLVLLYLLFFTDLKDGHRDLINILVGAYVGVLAKSTDYWFKDKEDAEDKESAALNGNGEGNV